MVRNWKAEFSVREKKTDKITRPVSATVYGDTGFDALANLKSRHGDVYKVILEEKDRDLYNRIALARLERPDRCG